MVKRVIVPLVFGLGGLAVLLALGFWQLSRLEWKLDLIGRIEARIGDAPVAMPDAPDAQRDGYLPVVVEGVYTGEVVHVLSSLRGAGPGSRVMAVLEATGGRRLVVDRGFIAEAARGGADFAGGPGQVVGTLQWPMDSDSFTPAPDLARNLWFSRDIAPIAAHLGAEPVLIVARADLPGPAGLITQPIDSHGLKNDHLGYAITWFLLAAVWAGMTAFLMWRIRQAKV